MTAKTPLHSAHVDAGAKMIDFGGWDMPIHYGSQIEEHHAVRRHCGMFDVSHMTVVDLRGPRCREFLSYLLANDIAKLKTPGKALYSCMLNAEGGVIDDLITYFMDESWFRMVVNAATRTRDVQWITSQAHAFDVAVSERPELAMIAVQGPEARNKVADQLGTEGAHEAILKIGRFAAIDVDGLFIARTGYTGEDGFEIIGEPQRLVRLWEELLGTGVQPCGLGARDTLRLEAGLNLYGQDMDESVTPFECGLAWTVAMKDDRSFVGRPALEKQLSAGDARAFIGLVLEGRGVLRHGQQIQGGGEITSGTFSPTTQRSIAMARVPSAMASQDAHNVDIRGRDVAAMRVAIPFVKNGESTFSNDD